MLRVLCPRGVINPLRKFESNTSAIFQLRFPHEREIVSSGEGMLLYNRLQTAVLQRYAIIAELRYKQTTLTSFVDPCKNINIPYQSTRVYTRTTGSATKTRVPARCIHRTSDSTTMSTTSARSNDETSSTQNASIPFRRTFTPWATLIETSAPAVPFYEYHTFIRLVHFS